MESDATHYSRLEDGVQSAGQALELSNEIMSFLHYLGVYGGGIGHHLADEQSIGLTRQSATTEDQDTIACSRGFIC